MTRKTTRKLTLVRLTTRSLSEVRGADAASIIITWDCPPPHTQQLTCLTLYCTDLTVRCTEP
jgi:hypothetical protein